MVQAVQHLSAYVEKLQLTPDELSLPVPAQKPTVSPTHEIFGLVCFLKFKICSPGSIGARALSGEA